MKAPAEVKVDALEIAERRDHEPHPRRAMLVFPSLCAVLVLLTAGSLLIGRYALPPEFWWGLLSHPASSGLAGVVLLDVRLPRVLAAALIGGALSVAGAAFQGLFRNPMASPDLLGAYAGAGLGASLGILFGFSIVTIQALGFVESLLPYCSPGCWPAAHPDSAAIRPSH